MAERDGSTVPFPIERRERLVMIFHPRRTGFLLHYIIGATIVLIGFGSVMLTAAFMIVQNEISWMLTLTSFFIGSVIMAAVEIHRRSILYIITTWNIRVRTGIFRKRTSRVFYNQISDIRLMIGDERRRISMGDVEFYTHGNSERPALVFREVYSPDGIKELVTRFIKTTPPTPDWIHLLSDSSVTAKS